MTRHFFVMLACLALSACAANPRQQWLQVMEVPVSHCADNKTQVEKNSCEAEIVLAKAKEINFPYYDLLDTSYKNDIRLAEKYDHKLISKNQYEKQEKENGDYYANLLMARIAADEQAEAVRSAKWAAAGKILGNAGANLSAASAPVYAPNNSISCTSYRQGYYTNTNCH